MRLPIALLILFFFSSGLNAQKLLIGTLRYNPPFEIESSRNQVIGFEIEFMNEICERMQANCQFVYLNLAQLFPQLLANKLDLALGSLIITRERQANYLFSKPYFPSKAQFIAKKNDSTITGLESIPKKRVGLVQGSLFKTLVLKDFPATVKIREYTKLAEVFQALANNAIDLAVGDEATIRYWVTNNSRSFKLVGNEIPLGVGYAIMTNKNHAALVEQINAALLAIQNDGTYDKIYANYFMPMNA